MSVTRPCAALLLTLGLAVLGPSGAAAQAPRLIRDLSGGFACTPGGESRPRGEGVRPAEVERLASEAAQASLVGDHAAALRLLERAVALEPASPDFAYRLARTLEALGRTDEALAAYCRFVGLSPDPVDTHDAGERMAALGHAEGLAVRPMAGRAFQSGLAHYDAGRLEEAEAAFGRAHDALPSWGAPLYNRGVVRLALGRREEASEDLERFLASAPEGAEPEDVRALLGDREDPPPARSPEAALVAGLIVPGLGHIQTGRPAAGALLLGTAIGAVAAGLMIERVEVECLARVRDGRCPRGMAVGERSDRPYLRPGIAVAALLGVFGAIDAYAVARRRGSVRASLAESDEDAGAGARVSLAPPRVRVGPDGGARLDLVRVRF